MVSDAQNQEPANRASLQFILASTAGTGIFLAIYDASADSALLVNVANMLLSFVYGCCLATWWLAARRLLGRQSQFPSQPGHWLCIVTPVLQLSVFIEGYAQATVDPSQHDFIAIFIRLLRELLLTAAWACPFLIYRKRTEIWSWYFAARSFIGGLNVLALVFLLAQGEGSALHLSLNVVSTILLFPTYLFATACAVLDISKPKDVRRDAYHWLGITATLLIPVFPWAITLLLFLIF